MGYVTRVVGAFRIEPPLTWVQIRDTPILHGLHPTSRVKSFNAMYRDLGVKLLVNEDERETESGTLIVKTATHVVPAYDDAYKAYNLVEDIQTIMDAFPDNVFTGSMHCTGEDPGDVWQVIIDEQRRVAVKVKPVIVWPLDVEDAVARVQKSHVDAVAADLIALGVGEQVAKRRAKNLIALIIEAAWPCNVEG